MTKTNGISITTIRINSWNALSNSKIELLDYENLSILTNIEEEKDILKEKSNYLLNFLYTNIGGKKPLPKNDFKGLDD